MSEYTNPPTDRSWGAHQPSAEEAKLNVSDAQPTQFQTALGHGPGSFVGAHMGVVEGRQRGRPFQPYLQPLIYQDQGAGVPSFQTRLPFGQRSDHITPDQMMRFFLPQMGNIGTGN